LESPKLLNGTYRLSLWFGDGRVDYFHRQDCITFDVVNMAGLKQLPASSVGPVAPKCHWHFS
jgi:lipopolysaccharide transport system ATP-binding protein